MVGEVFLGSDSRHGTESCREIHDAKLELRLCARGPAYAWFRGWRLPGRSPFRFPLSVLAGAQTIRGSGRVRVTMKRDLPR